MTKAEVIFPPPDHDHGSCASAAITYAEELCAERAQRLTPMRRNVLEALLTSHKPLGAYEIMERLAQRSRPAPITVYRALDFLLASARHVTALSHLPTSIARAVCPQIRGQGRG